jgi:uncharacterized protein (DUF4415 family)
MNGDTIGKTSKTEPATDWRRLRGMSDEEVMPQSKKTVTMRLDADLLAWFRRQRGYQTRINAILRAYMNAHAEDR